MAYSKHLMLLQCTDHAAVRKQLVPVEQEDMKRTKINDNDAAKASKSKQSNALLVQPSNVGVSCDSSNSIKINEQWNYYYGIDNRTSSK